MKCLVTGGTGFIGHHLAVELVKQGHEVLVTGSCPERVPEGTEYLPHDLNGIDWRRVEGVDVCFHQAANNKTTETDHNLMLRSNLYATTDLFNALKLNSQCRKFVYASSTAVYGRGFTKDHEPFKETDECNPLNVYGMSKYRLDQYAISFASRHPDISIVGLRYCNVYGPGEEHKGPRMSMVTKLADKIKRGEAPVLFGNGDEKREWLYVKDAVRANLLAAEYDGTAIFNCATGDPITFNEVVGALWVHYKKKMPRPREPFKEIEYVENPDPKTYQDNVHTDMKKAQEFLGFSPEYSLMDGIGDYL